MFFRSCLFNQVISAVAAPSLPLYFFQRNHVFRTNHPHPPDFLLVLPNLPRHLLLPRSLERRRSEGVAQTEQHSGADQSLGAGCVFPGEKALYFIIMQSLGVTLFPQRFMNRKKNISFVKRKTTLKLFQTRICNNGRLVSFHFYSSSPLT